MTTRCEYCGQLYDGLSCPHCGAPRGDDVRTHDGHCYSGNNVVINGNDNVVSITSDGERIIYADDIPYVSTDNVVVYPDGTKHRMSDGKCIFYADDNMYWTSDGVVPSEKTDHADMSERKWAKKTAKKLILSIFTSIVLPLVLAALFVAFLILILVLIKSC